MRILVVVGYCLKVNSSANLCHAKYIDGLVQLGHEVDLLTVSEKNLNIDRSLSIPQVNRVVEYDASLYEQKGGQKKQAVVSAISVNAVPPQKQTIKHVLISSLKQRIRALYGVYGTDNGWALRAQHYRNSDKYDCVISLAYPPVSHKVVEVLLNKKRIKTLKWIQIWEDPWFADLSGMVPTEKIKKEEARVISKADEIYYVSPLTLMYQKDFFPGSASKMKWQPLPSYYDDKDSYSNFEEYHFGYFGDYSESVRNLKPFYEYAVDNRLNFTVCGRGSTGYKSTGTVDIHPRMPLSELKQYENKVNILVFVCNLKGGQIPGKIYQYAATNKYVLFILDGTETEKKVLYDYFSQFERFVFCENNRCSIKAAVERIVAGTLPESYKKNTTAFEPSLIIDNILQGK